MPPSAKALPLICGILTAVVSPARAQSPSPTDLDWLRGQVGDGALVYQHSGQLFLTELSDGNTVSLGSGEQPEFSPDSSKIAWIDGTVARGRMRKGDTTVHEIATGVSASGGVHWVSNTEVALVRSGKWRRVSLAGDESEVPALTALGTGGSETDVKLGADGVWSYANGATWKTSAGTTGDTGGTCSPSLSPDGKSVTGLTHGHKLCELTRIRSGGYDGQLDWVYDFNGDKGFDNHRWSSNHPDFVTAQDEKYNVMIVMKVGGTYCTRMGESGAGEMYGDFTVGDGAGDPWPGTAMEPILQLSPGSLNFAAIAGGGNPPTQTVTVTNAGTGTLDDVVVTSGAGWLSVQTSGTGNTQTLTNDVDVSGLTVGSYQQTVSISSANAPNSPRTYQVALNVSDAPALTQLVVTPASTTVVAGQSASFTAAGFDQNGDPYPSIIDWSVGGGGSLTPTSSTTATATHVTRFDSDGSIGSFVVRARSATVEGTATAVVEAPSSLHLKINCGDNGFTPSGWQDDDAFVTGGVDFIFSDTFSTGGVTNAAPADVYQTCVHRIRGVETEYGYDIDTVPDGDYTVRLHFGDAYGSRSIDVWLEGTEVISDLDIATAAGGTYQAYVVELDVTVFGGDGLQILLTDDSAEPADFFINGIEVIASDNQAPVVDAGADQNVAETDTIFLDGSATDDGVPGGPLSFVWSQEAGPGTITFADPTDPLTSATVDAAGAYTLRLTVDDGELTGADEVTITVGGTPIIDILSPLAGDTLVAGTRHHIRWTTENLGDVQIDVSLDDRLTWQNLVGSVDTSSAYWESFPWTVPDAPCEACWILIAGYYGEAPTMAGPFVITRADPEQLTAGCECTGTGVGGGWLVWLVGVAGNLGIGARRRRRRRHTQR